MSTSKETDLLAPIEIWEVMLDNSTIKFHKPLELTPTIMPHDPDEPGEIEYIEVVSPDVNIDVYADNREDLLEFIHSDIEFAWRHIVSVPDDKLDPLSQVIKQNYLAIAEVVDE